MRKSRFSESQIIGILKEVESGRHVKDVSLACRGLCDPVLPGSDDVQTLLKTFRRRLKQCVETLSRTGPGKELILFLDAIDNAAEQARDRGEDSFPTLLLESLQDQPVNGVKLIASCRSHRIPILHLHYHDFRLVPFALKETTSYLRARLALRSSPDCPGIWSFRDTYSADYVFPFLFHVALTAAANGREGREKDILPKELKPLCKRIRNDLIGDEFKKTLKERLRKSVRSKKAESDLIKTEITYEQKQSAERFINDRLSLGREVLANVLFLVAGQGVSRKGESLSSVGPPISG